MKNLIKKTLALFLITTHVANAGLPPTTTYVSGDTSNVTTFNFKFPNFAATRSGVTTTFGLLGVAGGGTGIGTFTSNLPIIGNGTSALAQGTVSGNTTKFVTTTGTLTNGHCVDIDSNGNFVDAGSACGSGGGSGLTVGTTTITSGTNGYIEYNNSGVLGEYHYVPIANGGTNVGSVTTSPTATAFAGWDANKNLSANDFISSLTATATAAGTTSLNVSSAQTQVFTGTLGQTVVFPNATTLAVGQPFIISNQSTAALTLQFYGGAAFTDAGSVSYGSLGSHASLYVTLQTNGSTAGTWSVLQGPSSNNAPTVQRFTTTGSGTYTTPANVSYIMVRAVGGGGGGSGSGSATGAGINGSAGGNTTFGTSLLTANGGSGGAWSVITSTTGGTATVAGVATPIVVLQGGNGSAGMFQVTSENALSGGIGGANPLGGAGASVWGATAGSGGTASTGAGGGGGGNSTTGTYVGSGGGAGGYIEALIVAPGTSYSFNVGTGGTGGAATGTTTPAAGGAGGSGFIEVTEFYNNSSGGGSGISIDTVGAATPHTITYGSTMTYAGTNGTLQTTTLTGATTLSLSALSIGVPYTFIVKQDSTGSRVMTWPTVKVSYGGSGAPPQSTTASAIDIYHIFYDGTNYYIDYALGYN